MNRDLAESLKDLYRVQRKIDQLNKEKQRIREYIIDLIVDSRLEGRKFSVGDRRLSYGRKVTTQSITNKYLTEVINEFYQGDKRRADELYDFIQQNRGKTTNYRLDFTKIPNKRLKDKNYI